MNTKMLMLGILLIASLSFAKGGPENWMQAVEGRYYCHLIYQGQNLASYASGPLGATSDQAEQMNEYLWGDGTPGMANEVIDMYYAADCLPNGGAHITEFRQSMLAYNVNAAGFRSVFLQALRNYLAAHPGDRDHIMDEMAYFNGLYRDCLPGTYCENPPI